MYGNWLKGKATPIKFFLHFKKSCKIIQSRTLCYKIYQKASQNWLPCRCKGRNCHKSILEEVIYEDWNLRRSTQNECSKPQENKRKEWGLMLIQGAQGGDNKTWGNKNPLAAPTTHDNLMAATEGWSSICHSHLYTQCFIMSTKGGFGDLTQAYY